MADRSVELDYSLDLTGWQDAFLRAYLMTVPPPPPPLPLTPGVAAAAVDQLVARMDPDPVVCPECAAGKCGNCDGGAWDHELDAPTACLCIHRGP